MTDHSPENTQFFLTAAMPCPYLEGREERKLFTHLTGRRAGALHHLLSDHGFRRSQNLIYRPACEGCMECRSVRIVADRFRPTGSQRRIGRVNADLISEKAEPQITPEQYDLFRAYLESRHAGGGMTQMSYVDYEYMVEDTPVRSMLIEYRVAAEHGAKGELLGVALTDILPDGFSMVYSFFDPTQSRRSLGKHMILDHIERARAAGLDYVYLGYWVKESPKMAYKSSFRPLEVQSGTLGWQDLS
jgi:arginine-tRNA-protein transferase